MGAINASTKVKTVLTTHGLHSETLMTVFFQHLRTIHRSGNTRERLPALVNQMASPNDCQVLRSDVMMDWPLTKPNKTIVTDRCTAGKL